MSALAPARRRPWIFIAAAFLATLMAAMGYVVVDRWDGLRGNEESPVGPSEPAVEQAPWKIRTFPAGVARPLSRKEKAALRRQSGKLAVLVGASYDALFLDTDELNAVAARYFSPRAAKALFEAGVGFPDSVARVRIIARRARIGIGVGSMRRAAVSIRVLAAGTVRTERRRVRHEATLWAEKSSGKWKVMAFDVDQGPIP